MKKLFLIISIFIATLIISQCSQPRVNVFNQDVLQFQKFEIDTSKDTLIKTAGGIVVQIKAGSLSSSSGNNVVLKIKEALQLADMIKAGLTTTANGELLSSSGMFFIEPEDKSVQITSELTVSIPTDFIEPTSLYKGTEIDDGKINWESPEPVRVENKYAKGEELFKLNCTQCHTVGQGTVIGPALDHITKRRDYRWLEAFTTNSQEYLRGYDTRLNSISDTTIYDSKGLFLTREQRISANYNRDFYFFYSHCHFNEFNKVVMPSFNFTHDEMRQIYDYIENESVRLRLPMPEDKLFYCVDSCLKYTSLKTQLEKKRDALIGDNGRLLKRENILPPDTSTTPVNNNAATNTNVISPVAVSAKYYQVNIKTFGWFNIDILLKDINGVQNSNLVVRIRGAYKENISLFLVIPSLKVFLEGGKLTTGENDYGFFEEDGAIPLPQRQTIYVFAAGEGNGKFIFTNAEFIAAAEQIITIEPAETTKEAFDAAINKMSVSGIEVSLDKTKNADLIGDLEKNLSDVENLKPKNCDCDCAQLGGEASIEDILRCN